ncbi:hypothetical protein HMN09_00210400 [Mycena chlorophos]|uniref:Uncharacterized protein n=1 Tax=Mycena chlorophos TaxID=658473 RepID=A0A8H6TQE2_MYCCL|nr:hypothetical protein HMN09_00210400 [Mycena chlorophos]
MYNIAFSLVAAAIVFASSALAFLPQELAGKGLIFGTDPGSDWTIAYDKDMNEVTRIWTPSNGEDRAVADAPGSKCRALKEAELKSLPVWPKMQAYANQNFGTGSYNLYFGDSGNRGGAQVAWTCMKEGVIQMYAKENPVCTRASGSTSGSVVGTNGTVSITVSSTTAATNSITVTQASKIGVGFSTTVTIGNPEVASVSASTSFNVEFENTQGSTMETTTSSQVATKYTLNAVPGKTCRLDYTDETCHELVKGDVPFTIQGYVTFGYNAPTRGHYYWYVYLSNFDVADRTSTTELTGSLTSRSKSGYHGECY